MRFTGGSRTARVSRVGGGGRGCRGAGVETREWVYLAQKASNFQQGCKKESEVRRCGTMGWNDRGGWGRGGMGLGKGVNEGAIVKTRWPLVGSIKHRLAFLALIPRPLPPAQFGLSPGCF